MGIPSCIAAFIAIGNFAGWAEESSNPVSDSRVWATLHLIGGVAFAIGAYLVRHY